MAQLFDRLSLFKRYFQLRIMRETRFLLMACGLALLLLVIMNPFSYLRDARSNLKDGNYRVAFSHYIKQAENGDLAAQNVIGNLYFLGLGVEQNRPKAARWYLKAALQGYAPAQINLGQMYLNGTGLKVNKLKAAGWFRLAKQQGNKRADKHTKYMILANDILPSMLGHSKVVFRDIDTVRRSVKELGELGFLLN